MRLVQPKVSLISSPQIHPEGLLEHLEEVGGEEWYHRVFNEEGLKDLTNGEALVEFAGRICYQSWAEGINPNVTKVRTDSAAYLRNILASEHGSVLEHAFYVFVITYGSRVFTPEMIRHSTGTSISEQSLRFVRLEDIPFISPDWALEDDFLEEETYVQLEEAENLQRLLANHFQLDSKDVTFSFKKDRTSYMRRFAPLGLATHMVFGANIRALRHIIESRTVEHAEWEIRVIADQIGNIMVKQAPLLFGDYKVEDKVWSTPYRKV